MKKTLDAKDVGLLKHLLAMELERLAERSGVSVILFMGTDGRLFSSYVPEFLSVREYHLLNLVQGNLTDLCSQLRRQNLKTSTQQYEDGVVFLSGVGKSAFLTAVVAESKTTEEIQTVMEDIILTAQVVHHIFELKPLTDEGLAEYPPEVKDELEYLGRQLFKERFTQTKDYKKNQEILNYIKSKIASVVGRGSVDEIVTMTFNEMGVRLGNMDRHSWMIFVDIVIKNHIAAVSGDIVAEQCSKTWVPDVERKLKSFI